MCLIHPLQAWQQSPLSLPVITAPQTVTAEIPWQAGQITTQGIQQEYVINRKFLSITPQGHYQVQDFYQHSGAKRTNPFITTNADRLLEMLPLYEDENIEGELSLWSTHGKKQSEAFYENNHVTSLKEWNARGQLTRVVQMTGSPETGNYSYTETIYN